MIDYIYHTKDACLNTCSDRHLSIPNQFKLPQQANHKNSVMPLDNTDLAR
ncbi:hypothetical protein HMPREF9370_0695 [Neisseria wadsworthii 9715]|uniref:Uncharacterized protein n=1 Tax=Neisseria wadsworthii 9715 TaxID=1030841 RepID=G4CNN6_9NEIS|nr:hypothetical protein HMPREF9370_0695 [Neisseria wadsworthii 9715]